jgi:agmatine/peptidylarginine deiminase
MAVQSDIGQQYRFPAEWEPHKGVWLAWPIDDDLTTLPIWKTTRRFATALATNGVNVFLCVVDENQRSFAHRYVSDTKLPTMFNICIMHST